MQSYRMPLDQCRRLTYPQILMLNHGAAVNKARLDRKLKTESAEPSQAPRARAPEHKGWPMFEGKPVNKLDGPAYHRYIMSAL